MNTMVYGNLALKPERRAPQLEVVSGKKPSYVIAAPRQVAAPDRYAAVACRPDTRASKALSAIGIIAVLSIMLAFTGVSSVLNGAARADAIASANRTEVSVLPGDSLWSIAERHSIAGLSTEESVQVISEWNDLKSSMLVAGTTLTVPAAIS